MPVTSYATLDGEILSESRGGARKDYLPDPLGSTIALLDSSQTKTDTWTYWPYGEERIRTGTTPTPFQFVGVWGYYEDSATRIYVRTRNYSSRIGQWISTDLLWPAENPYQYSYLNPASISDSSGLAPESLPCRNCPAFMSGVWGNLDSSLFDLWSSDYLGGNNAQKINNCIQNSSKALGVSCDGFTAGTLKCLKDSSMKTPISCDSCDDHPTWCAYTVGDYPNSRIVMCWPNVTTKECGNYGVRNDGVSSRVWISMLHELLHSCGYNHGKKHGGGALKAECTCNEIAVCCMRKIIEGGSTNPCRVRPDACKD